MDIRQDEAARSADSFSRYRDFGYDEKRSCTRSAAVVAREGVLVGQGLRAAARLFGVLLEDELVGQVH